jgi:hypothetical protein
VRQRRLVTLVVVFLLAAIGGAVYRTRVFSDFEPIRTDVLTARLHSSGQAVTIVLPNLANLRGQPAVLGLHLQNTLLESRQVAIARDGFPREPVALPPNRTVHWNIALSAETVRALASETDETRALVLRGDADGWDVAAAEVRNYYVRVGGRPALAILPGQSDAYTPGSAFLGVSLVLCLLSLGSVLVAQSRGRRFGKIGNGLVFTAALLLLACLLLPLLSPHKVVISPLVFLVIVAGSFAPLLLHAVSTLVLQTFPLVPGIAGFGKRHEVTVERGAALAGLVALAIAQPIFEVDVRITIRNRRRFDAVNLASDPLPLYVTGTLTTAPRGAAHHRCRSERCRGGGHSIVSRPRRTRLRHAHSGGVAARRKQLGGCVRRRGNSECGV